MLDFEGNEMPWPAVFAVMLGMAFIAFVLVAVAWA